MFSFNYFDYVCIIFQESEGLDFLLSMMEVGFVVESMLVFIRKFSKDIFVFQIFEGSFYFLFV